MTNWNVEEALETIRHGGRFGAKRVREAVYKDNFEESEFMGKFRNVVFAILEGSGARRPVEEQGKFSPFYMTFGRWGT